MAEVVNEFPDNHRLGRPIYDWDKWFDGQVWKLTKVIDFTEKPLSFCNTVRYAAKKRKIKVEIAKNDNAVYIRKL